MTLLDAMYKTTMYNLAPFLSQFERIQGTLLQQNSSFTLKQMNRSKKLWTSWNSGIHFGHLYTLCVIIQKLKILAIETAFPCATVYLCDFHREQCWERWVKNHKHGLTDNEASELLDLLRDCAWAPPCRDNGKQQDYHYQQAVERLKASPVWNTHEQVQMWLTTGWLSIPKVTWHDMINILDAHECNHFCTNLHPVDLVPYIAQHQYARKKEWYNYYVPSYWHNTTVEKRYEQHYHKLPR